MEDNIETKAATGTLAGRAKENIKKTRPTRWVRFGLVAALYTAWVAWLGNWWFLLGLPVLFDLYVSGLIPLSWWKKSDSKALRFVMGWVDAIVYALVIVYFIFNFLGQNYQIPSSSLEKTLLTGDYLWVNKMVYGPRVPMTPVHFPLVHNRLPIIGTDSYLDRPQNPYRRLKGLRKVQTGDIVVFNFPAGDTVATKMEDSALYYDLLVKQYGWAEVNTDKEAFGEIKFRPVDRRTNFVKRAVGLPGQRLRIAGDVIYIDGKAQKQPANVQFRYVAAMSRPFDDQMLKKYGIAAEDVLQPDRTLGSQLAVHMGLDGDAWVYLVPLTQGMINRMTADGVLEKAVKSGPLNLFEIDNLFPEGVADVQGWTLSDYGGKDGLLIPKKGMTITLTPQNWLTYKRVIRNYEGHADAYMRDDTVYIGGKPAKDYTFAMDYYFMMGDNRDMSQDSRFWGFVPEDHIVGTPMVVLVSFDKERGLFDGGIRWNRILTDANPDKK